MWVLISGFTFSSLLLAGFPYSNNDLSKIWSKIVLVFVPNTQQARSFGDEKKCKSSILRMKYVSVNLYFCEHWKGMVRSELSSLGLRLIWTFNKAIIYFKVRSIPIFYCTKFFCVCLALDNARTRVTYTLYVSCELLQSIYV